MSSFASVTVGTQKSNLPILVGHSNFRRWYKARFITLRGARYWSVVNDGIGKETQPNQSLSSRSIIHRVKPSIHGSNEFTNVSRFGPSRLLSQISDRKHLIDGDSGRSTLHTHIEDSKEIGEVEISTENSRTPSSLPWYLLVGSQPTQVKQKPERQRIPELPDSPPPILKPLLDYMSENLGLDYITLLDLRKLDPPPSLGANLLMLIATARGEKHLQVSANRLSRWLRSEYKLRPDADGLLGRNELKTRLKRKAKRAKLVGNNFENYDDGIRSGWICVDLGIVDDGEAVSQKAWGPKDVFIGFGRPAQGARIVIQLLTAEKREELALENLWTGIMKKEGLSEGPKRFNEDEFLIKDEPQNTTLLTANDFKSELFSLKGQIRSFHKYVRNSSISRQCMDSDYIQPAESYINADSIKKLLISFSSENYDKFVEMESPYSGAGSNIKSQEWRPFILESLLNYLKSLPEEEAIRCLGKGYSDCNSTSFLACYYQTLSLLTFGSQLDTHIEFFCYAHKLKVVGYDSQAIRSLLKKLSLNGLRVSEKSYMRILETILSSDNSYSTVDTAADVLTSMHDQGFDILNENMLVKLQLLTSRNDLHRDYDMVNINQDSNDSFDLPCVPMPEMQERVHLLMTKLELPLFSVANRIQLLKLYASHGYWTEFWEVFCMASRCGQPQTKEIYAHMFSLVSTANSQKASCTVLRRWFPVMLQEFPTFPINNEELAKAIKACILLSDPDILQKIESEPKCQGEFVSMWRRCHEHTWRESIDRKN